MSRIIEARRHPKGHQFVAGDDLGEPGEEGDTRKSVWFLHHEESGRLFVAGYEFNEPRPTGFDSLDWAIEVLEDHDIKDASYARDFLLTVELEDDLDKAAQDLAFVEANWNDLCEPKWIPTWLANVGSCTPVTRRP